MPPYPLFPFFSLPIRHALRIRVATEVSCLVIFVYDIYGLPSKFLLALGN